MNRNHRERIRALFAAARKLDPEARKALLDRECDSAPELRTEIESLLHHDKAAVVFERPAVQALIRSSSVCTASERGVVECPERIGVYKILALLGEGGMGTVYLAEQENPHRHVALKVIRFSRVSNEVRRRFEHEVEMLGRLRHPGIAHIYDAGVHEGMPFFAMEFIEGQRITNHVETKRLDVRQRLELFIKVCEGVVHAHQKGVVHRDLKPDNILVEDSGQPKILDFGVAKATDSDLKSTTLQTDMGRLVGTVQYMSPEQAAGNRNDLDTRSDVYAMGVVLYELLARELPYDFQDKLVHEAVQVIQEKEPSRLSSVNRVFRGDIETIVAKALEKEKDLRYQSTSDLAADIRRYLNNEPIIARPPSAGYRFWKFAKRHKAFVGGTLSVFVVLLLGMIGTYVGLTRAKDQAAQATKANELAQERLDEVRRVSSFQADMLRSVDPEQLGKNVVEDLRKRIEEGISIGGTAHGDSGEILANLDKLLGGVNCADLGRELLHANVLRRASETVALQFSEKPRLAARLRNTLGETYDSLGIYKTAQAEFEKAFQLCRQELGEEDVHTLTSMQNLAMVHRKLGHYDEAEALYLRALETRRRVLGEENRATLVTMNNLATLYLDIREHKKAEPLIRRALEVRRRTLGEAHRDTLVSLITLATLHHKLNQCDEAEQRYREALQIQGRVLGLEHRDALACMNNLAMLYTQQARYEEAKDLFVRVLEIKRRVRGKEHLETLITMVNLADLYYHLAAYGDAKQLSGEVVVGLREQLGPRHGYTAAALFNYGRSLAKLRQYEEAEETLLDSHGILAALVGPQDNRTAKVTRALVELYETWDRPDKVAEWRTRLAAGREASVKE